MTSSDKKVRHKITATFIAATVTGAIAFIAPWEGRSLKAYQDIVGVWTICNGHTKGVFEGLVVSEKKCDEFLKSDTNEMMNGLQRAIKVPVTQNEMIAYTSFSFNVGLGNFNSSTLKKKLNTGDYAGACNELPKWIYAKGNKLNGLVKRREAERQLCLK